MSTLGVSEAKIEEGRGQERFVMKREPLFCLSRSVDQLPGLHHLNATVPDLSHSVPWAGH